MERNIGDPGEYLNSSMASRAANIEPDMAKVRRLDIFHRRYRNTLIGLAFSSLLLLAGGAALWYFHHPIWGSLLILPALPLLYLATRVPQTLVGDAYRNGLLIPGIISNLTPLTITCLADVTTGEYEPGPNQVQWGVREVVIPQLTVQPERLGEQVPCVALFGPSSESNDFYLAYEPRPLAWGTHDARLIEQARQAIDEEEWELLPPLAAAFAASEKNSDGLAYFDEELKPLKIPRVTGKV